MGFHNFIKAVGTGKRHNRDLSQEEMREAIKNILDLSIYPEQASAFLLGWRVKPETIDEFIGALKAFDEYIIKTPIDNSIEIGYPYDGKVNNPYLFPLVAKVLDQNSINLIISGDKLQPAKRGVTTKEICNNITLSDNLYFFDRSEYFKQLSDLTEVRTRLGLRTGLNSIERLLNPADSKSALLGVFHKPFVEKYVQIFSNRYEKLVIVKGNEGTPEIFGKCKYWIVQNNQKTEYTIDPEYYGIKYKKSWNRISLEESLKAINDPSDEFLKLAKLNAALLLFISGNAKSINEGFEIID